MAYKEELILKAKGIHAYSDTLGSVPEGSLKEATNVVLDKTDLISPRRGFSKLPGSISGTLGSLYQYTDGDNVNHLLAHRNGTTLAYYVDSTDTWTDYTGTFNTPNSANVIRTMESNKNLYFTTDKGVQKIDAVDSDPVDSGAPQGLDLRLASTASGNAVDPGNAVGYRLVWGYKDANDNTILGAPSNKFIYNNDNPSAQQVTIRSPIPTPPVVATTWFVQLYRTAGIGSIQVGDEMALVAEQNVAQSDIDNGYIDILDPTPDTLRGAALYTNATQEGLINANYQPPQCTDMALFQGHAFYANTESKYEFQFTLLNARGSSSGSTIFVFDDTVTIDGVVYTGKATANLTAGEFEVGDTGDDAVDIETTARSLVDAINTYSSNTTVWAVYTSGEEELPGTIRVFERDFGDAASFTVISSKGGAFSPNLTTSQTSTNNKTPNRVYYSKAQEPEAVPTLNFLDVGPANRQITRILSLRSILLVFTDAGVYRITGTSPSTFQVFLLDGTAKLLAPESLVAYNNTATGLFDQGVSQVTASAVTVISRPIEGKFLELRGATGDNLSAFAFGVSYESDRKYLIAVPQTSSDTTNSIIYVYNSVTSSWTTYDLARTAGIVRDGDDKLYLASYSTVHVERKQFDETDYTEEAIDVTVTAIDASKTRITVASLPASVKVGYAYYESDTKFSIITALEVGTNTIIVQDALEWITGSREVRPYITTTIEWNPVSAETPNMLKQWSECTLMTELPLQDAVLSFKTLLSGNFEGVDIIDNPIGLWGLFPWGEVPWGGVAVRSRYRTYIPRAKQRDAFIVPKLVQNTVFTPFEIAGLSFYYRHISNRTTR